MDIKRSGSQPSGKGQAEHFTGMVRIDPCFKQTLRRARAAPVSRSSLGSDRMAQSPFGPDPDCDGGLRSGAKLGRPDRGNSTGGRDLDRLG